MTEKKQRSPGGKPFKDSRGLWTVAIELPNPTGLPADRRRKYVRSKNKQKVVDKAAALRVELQERGDLITSSPNVAEWFAIWLNRQAREVRPKAFASYRSVVRNHIVPALGEKTKLTKITPALFRRIHATMEHSGLSPTYIRNAHHVAAKALEAAYREGHMQTNPANLLDPPRRQVANLDVLTLPEAMRLLAHLADRPDRARWATSLLTGARRGEVLGLELDRVGNGDVVDLSWQLQRLEGAPGAPIVPPDFEHRHLTGGLYLTRPKSRAGWRVIPLVEPLRSILQRHIHEMPPNPYGLLFTRDGEPRDPDWDSKQWRVLMREVFGEKRTVRLHDLRHTAVDLLYLAGVPEDLITEIVGHSTRQMSRAYKTRGNQDRLRSAMEQLGGLFVTPTAAELPAP